jgi:hypothetical protein
VAGAIVGGTVGTLAGAFAQAGYENDEAEFYGTEVNNGAYLVAVDAMDSAEAARVREVLNGSNARYYERASNTMMGSNSNSVSSR